MSEFTRSSFDQHSLSPTPSPDYKPERSDKPAGRSKIKFCSCLLIFLIGIFLIASSILGAINKSFFGGLPNGYIVRQLTHIFDTKANELRGEADDRINFLLLGMGGPGHEGPYLSDTIILASFKPSTKQAALISLPRDMIVPYPDGSYRKINSVFALYREQGREYAFTETKKIIGDAFDLPIHYMSTIDFQGFVDIIDAVGGLTIDVDKTFTDPLFPTADKLTTTVTFKEGKQKMDGKTALTYARSRHGNNGEGSDFARSRRQQKIIFALKDKLTSFNTLINPVKITKIFNLLTQYTAVDMEVWEGVKLAQMGKDIHSDQVYHLVLDDAPGGFLIGGISALDGAYILQPRNGSYGEIRSMVASIFDRPGLVAETSSLIIQNGTPIPGLATEAVNELQKRGLTIDRYGNADTQNYISTTIYDYTKGKKPETRKLLEDYFHTQASENPPLSLLSYNVAKAWNYTDDNGNVKTLDFLVILGQNYTVNSDASGAIIPTVTPTSTATTTVGDNSTESIQ